MAPLILRAAHSSFCSLRVMTAVYENGIEDFEFVPVSLPGGEHKSEAHKALNPFGKLPVLDDNGFILYESRAIVRYITAKFGNGTLMPSATDFQAVGRFEQAASNEFCQFDSEASAVAFLAMVVPLHTGQPTDASKIDPLMTTVNSNLDVIDSILSKQKFMAGDTFSIVDIFYMPIINVLLKIGNEEIIAERKHLRAWWAIVSVREAWKKAVGDHDAAWAAMKRS